MRSGSRPDLRIGRRRSGCPAWPASPCEHLLIVAGWRRGWVLGDHGRRAAGVPGAAAPLVLGVMFPRFRIMLRDSPGAANWRTRRAARDWLTAIRVGGRWPVGTRADAGAAGSLVFAVAAGW